MCHSTKTSIPRSSRRSLVESVGLVVGPATLALERSTKRRRVSNEKEDVVAASVAGRSMDSSLDDLFSSLAESSEEEPFPTIAWVFDDDE